MKLLLVDDDEDIRTVASFCLRKIGGFEVVLADSAAECLRKAPVEKPDVVLLDVMMPGVDGVEALSQLRANPDTRSIPVIFLTAKVQRHEIEHYLSLGAEGVLQKPFDPMRLPQQVRDLLAASKTKELV